MAHGGADKVLEVMHGVLAPAGSGGRLFHEGAAAIAVRREPPLDILDDGGVFLKDFVEEFIELPERGVFPAARGIDNPGLKRGVGRQGLVDDGNKTVGVGGPGPEYIGPLSPRRQPDDVAVAQVVVVEARGDPALAAPAMVNHMLPCSQVEITERWVGDRAVIAFEIVLDNGLPVGPEHRLAAAHLAHDRKPGVVVEQQTFNLPQVGVGRRGAVVETDHDKAGEQGCFHRFEGRPMGPRIVEGAKRAVLFPPQNNVMATNRGRQTAARFGQVGIMGHGQPGAAEHRRHLMAKMLGIEIPGARQWCCHGGASRTGSTVRRQGSITP